MQIVDFPTTLGFVLVELEEVNGDAMSRGSEPWNIYGRIIANYRWDSSLRAEVHPQESEILLANNGRPDS